MILEECKLRDNKRWTRSYHRIKR